MLILMPNSFSTLAWNASAPAAPPKKVTADIPMTR